MSDTTRTFIAVAVPEALTTRMERLQRQLSPELPGVRMSAALPFHVTLAFLGDVPSADLNSVCKAVAEDAAAFGPLELTLEGLGVFPNPSRPRVLWTGVGGDGVGALRALQGALAEAAARAGFPADTRPFQPHVTLGYFKPAKGRNPTPAPAPDRALSHMLGHYKTWHAGPFGVSEAVVFSSTLARDGPEYAAVARLPLRGRKSDLPP